MTQPELHVSLDKLQQHHKDLLALYGKLLSDRAIARDTPLSQYDFGRMGSCATVAKSWNDACTARAAEAEEIRDVLLYVTNSLDEIRELYIADDQEASREFRNIPEGTD